MDYKTLGEELLKIEQELSSEIRKSQSKDQKTIVLSKFYPRPFTEQILSEYQFRWEGNRGYLWWYDPKEGIWKPNGEDFVMLYFRKYTDSLDDSLKKRRIIDEIIADLQGYTLSLEGMPGPDNDLIPCQNGVYNLKTDEFSEFKAEYFFTWKLPWRWNPSASCDYLKGLINTLLPEREIITLWELMAYCLYQGYPYQKFFILLGSGRNGKGVFLTILTRLLGAENVSNISLQDLQNNRFSASALYHKLANISGEVHYDDLTNTQILKQLTGGDWIEADRKYKKSIKFVNHAKLIFATNQIPKTRDKTDAFFRRAFIVRFPYKFKDDPSIDIKIRENSPEIQQEYEGLLFEVIQHLKRLKAQNFIFTKHQDIKETKAIYERLSNPIIQFIDEFCDQTFDNDDFIFKYEFSERFNEWAQDKGFNKMSNERIGREMKELGFEEGRKGKKRYRAWIGIKWNDLSVQDVQDVQVYPYNSHIYKEKVYKNMDNLDNMDTDIIEGELL